MGERAGEDELPWILSFMAADIPQSYSRKTRSTRAGTFSLRESAHLGICNVGSAKESEKERGVGLHSTLSISNQIMVRPSLGAGPRGTPALVVTWTEREGVSQLLPISKGVNAPEGGIGKVGE